MERIRGVLISFVSNPRQGHARTADNRQVFLPGANMRKSLNGSSRHYAVGEERPIPPLYAELVMDVAQDGKGFIANNWALDDPSH